MSEIQVLLPLSMLGDDLSKEGIVKELGTLGDKNELIKQQQLQIDMLAKGIRTIGSNLGNILDNMDGLQKSKALRDLEQSCREFKSKGESE